MYLAACVRADSDSVPRIPFVPHAQYQYIRCTRHSVPVHTVNQTPAQYQYTRCTRHSVRAARSIQ
eukprot:2527633-Rhodomonas_salina.1